MRHRRGIDLTRFPDPPYVERPKEVADLYDVAGKFQDLSSWALIGGRCAKCEREGWIDRDWLEARYPNAIIGTETQVPEMWLAWQQSLDSRQTTSVDCNGSGAIVRFCP